MLSALGIALAVASMLGAGQSPSAADAVSDGQDPPTFQAADTVTSWNPNVMCEGNRVTVADILGTAYPEQSVAGSPWQQNATLGGVPHPRDLTPPCTITNASGIEVGTFVQVDRVYLADFIYQPFDCDDHFARVNGGGPYPNNETICESQGTLFEMGTTEGFIQIEFEKDWLAAGYCGPDVPYCDNTTIAQYGSNGTIALDLQGFVFWDGENWELHPFTSWRLSAPPDFSIAAEPGSMRIPLGKSAVATIVLTSLNGFAGTVDLSASIVAVDVPPLVPTIYPTATLEPAAVTLSAGGTGQSTLAVSASLLTTPGTYEVTVTATDGSITRTVTIAVEIVLL